MEWIRENAGTLVVSLFLLLMTAGIVRHLIREKKRGKAACGNSCACCPMCGSCHKQQ